MALIVAYLYVFNIYVSDQLNMPSYVSQIQKQTRRKKEDRKKEGNVTAKNNK